LEHARERGVEVLPDLAAFEAALEALENQPEPVEVIGWL
jgi:hypothetical protein